MLQNTALGSESNSGSHFINKNLTFEEGQKPAHTYPGIKPTCSMPTPNPTLLTKGSPTLTYFTKTDTDFHAKG